MHKVYISKITRGYLEPLAAGLEWTGISKELTSGTRVCIKPNLTFPSFRPGVMTNPDAVEALVRYLLDFTPHVTICESDSGGYNPFSMDEVFQRTGLMDMANRYGVRIVNVSRVPSRTISFKHHYRNISVPLPAFLLEETDLFITLPVPKIHMNTIVSMSVKNQWGMIQTPSERLKLHPFFAKVVYEVNKAISRSISIIDGRYGLTRSGPMKGDPVDLNWVLVADNIYAADFVCSHLMGIDPFSVPYLRTILRAESISSLDQIRFNCDHQNFIGKQRFFLHRKWTDYPGLFAFNSRTLAYLGYESFLAGPLHWLLYRFREPFYKND